VGWGYRKCAKKFDGEIGVLHSRPIVRSKMEVDSARNDETKL
jgi:hypothetical protein